jgi:hypothetical protein
MSLFVQSDQYRSWVGGVWTIACAFVFGNVGAEPVRMMSRPAVHVVVE